jgi:hypothetical protein
MSDRDLRSDLYSHLLSDAEAWLFQYGKGTCRQCGHKKDNHASGQQCTAFTGIEGEWCFCTGIDDLLEGVLGAAPVEPPVLTPMSLSVAEEWPISSAPWLRVRRVGWLNQKGRVWTEIPPISEFDGGSLTPLLIQLEDKKENCRHENWDGHNPHCFDCGEMLRDTSAELP